MLEGLKEFQSFPCATTAEIVTSEENRLLFILDAKRQPNAIVRLYQLGEDLNLGYLYADTELASVAQKGPIWFSAHRDSQLARLGMQLCHERHAGIIIAAEDERTALAHARGLIRVRDLSGGESLIAFHLPSVWAALALTLSSDEALFGPWRTVYSPAPQRLNPSDGWHSWTSPGAASSPDSRKDRLSIASTTPAYMRTLRWVYWIDEELEAFRNPTVEQLPGLIANLETLVGHRVYEGRHLLKVVELIGGPLIDEQPQVMSILRTPEEAFLKIEKLQALTLTEHQA